MRIRKLKNAAIGNRKRNFCCRVWDTQSERAMFGDFLIFAIGTVVERFCYPICWCWPSVVSHCSLWKCVGANSRAPAAWLCFVLRHCSKVERAQLRLQSISKLQFRSRCGLCHYSRECHLYYLLQHNYRLSTRVYREINGSWITLDALQQWMEHTVLFGNHTQRQ